MSDVGVLIVDDSAVVRRALTEQLGRQPGIQVLGTATDPYVARDKIAQLSPDVITLDIEMPRMDGLTFLRKLMKYHPVPAIIVSSVTTKGCATAIACLEAGAIGVVPKPSEAYSVGDLAGELGGIIRSVRDLKLTRHTVEKPPASSRAPAALPKTTNHVIATGSSTGGTDALARILPQLPRNAPGIVMTQHMPAGFTTAFARRLNDLCEIEIAEAMDGDIVGPGRALLAPGDRHMRLVRDGALYRVRVQDGPRVRRHRPSVEVLFESVAEAAGSNAMGVIMTGMGDDGAGGLKAMRDAGAYTIAQDEASCIVFGMPGAAVKLDAACGIVPLDAIPGEIVRFATKAVAA